MKNLNALPHARTALIVLRFMFFLWMPYFSDSFDEAEKDYFSNHE